MSDMISKQKCTTGGFVMAYYDDDSCLKNYYLNIYYYSELSYIVVKELINFIITVNGD